MKLIEPDRAALEIAHRMLMTPIPLDDMLKDVALTFILKNVARIHIRKRERFDAKKLQSNDVE